MSRGVQRLFFFFLPDFAPSVAWEDRPHRRVLVETRLPPRAVEHRLVELVEQEVVDTFAVPGFEFQIGVRVRWLIPSRYLLRRPLMVVA